MTFWEHVQPLVPKRRVRRAQRYQRRPRWWAQTAGRPSSLPTHCLCAAHRLPMEGLPKSFGSGQRRPQAFQRWRGEGFSWPCGGLGWPNIDEMEGVLLGSGKVSMDSRQSATGAGAVGRQTTDRGKVSAACWWTVLVSRCPLSSAGPTGMMSNCCDHIWIALWSCVPEASRRRRQNLCADKGYAGRRPAAQAMQERGLHTTPVRQRGEEARACQGGQRAAAAGW